MFVSDYLLQNQFMALNRTQAVKILTSNQCEGTQKYQQCVTIQSPARTPIRHSPTKNVIGISQVQKQAFIDNLQLESEL